MSIIGRCGGCEKVYTVGEHLAGKKARCKNCGGIIAFPSAPMKKNPLDQLEALAAMESAAPQEQPVAAPTRSVKQRGAATGAWVGSGTTAAAPQVVAPPRSNAPVAAFTDRDRLMLRWGISLLVFGIGGLVLPLFGLQFSKLAKVGDEAVPVSIALIVIGAIVSGVVLVRRRPKFALIVGGSVVGACVLLSILGSLITRGARHGGAGMFSAGAAGRTAAEHALRNIGRGIDKYAEAHGGQCPHSLAELAAEGFIEQSDLHGSGFSLVYEWTPGPRSAIPAKRIMAFEMGVFDNQRSGLLGDGSVQTVELSHWGELTIQSMQAR